MVGRWSCCGPDCVLCVFLSPWSPCGAGEERGWSRAVHIPGSEQEEKKERRKEEVQGSVRDVDSGVKIHRVKALRRLRSLPWCLLGRWGAASSSDSHPSDKAAEVGLKRVFTPWKKRVCTPPPPPPPPRFLTPPAIFVLSPEETEAAVAMDARRHRRASEVYNVDSEDDLELQPEEPYPGMDQDRFFSPAFEEGWTTVGETTVVMDCPLPGPSTDPCHTNQSRSDKSPISVPFTITSNTNKSSTNMPSTNMPSGNTSSTDKSLNLHSQSNKFPNSRSSLVSDVPPAGVKEPSQDASKSPRKTGGSLRPPFSSPKKANNNKLAHAAVESSPKKLPRSSPKNSPNKAKSVAALNSPQGPRRVLPEILQSSVQQYRPVYSTSRLDNTNLVPKPYCSRYAASLTSPPFRGPVACPRTILPNAGTSPSVQVDEGGLVPLFPREPKNTEVIVKKSVRSDAAPTGSTGGTSPTRPINPINAAEPEFSSPEAPRSPADKLKTLNQAKAPTPIPSPSRIPASSPTLSSASIPDCSILSPTTSPISSPVYSPIPSPVYSPIPSPVLSPRVQDWTPATTDLDHEEFLALSALDSALLDTPRIPSLYSCSNEPFNSYEELQSMKQKDQPPHYAADKAEPSRSSSRTKTSEEYSGDVESGNSNRTSECLDTTLSKDSLSDCNEVNNLQSFVAQKDLATSPSQRSHGNEREDSVEFQFEELEDYPVHGSRDSVKTSGGDTLAAEEKKTSRLSPKFGRFTQKVSDKKESEEKNKSHYFRPLNILSLGAKDKKTKAKISETDSPKTEGWTSETIEKYLLQTSREESVKLGLLTEEDIAYHEAKAAGRQTSVPRPLPDVTISDKLQPPATPSRRRAAPSSPYTKPPSWKPQDIENYLLEHNMDENLRLGLLSQEDIEIYEWKRATGMSPICDTSWTRETLRRNRVVYSSDSSVSGSIPASPDPGCANARFSPTLISAPTSPLHPSEKPSRPDEEEVINTPSHPLPVSQKRVRAPLPPIGIPTGHGSSLSSSAPTSEISKNAGHFAFRGFKLGQRVGRGIGKASAPESPGAGATLQRNAVKESSASPEVSIAEDAKAGGLRSRFIKPKFTCHRVPKATDPTSEVMALKGTNSVPKKETGIHWASMPEVSNSRKRGQESDNPEISKGRESCSGVSKGLSRPRRLPLEKIGMKLPGLTGRIHSVQPAEDDTEAVSVECIPSKTSTQAHAGDRASHRKTPYSVLTRLLRKDPTVFSATPDAPVHAYFLRESPREAGATAVTDEDEGGVRKKLSDMRLRLGCLRRRGDSQGSVRPMPEEVQGWAESFHNLMASKYGQALFKAFLQREFSEENVEFWLAVEDFKKTRSAKIPSKACKIHSDYVAVQAPKELNLDPGTRAQIAKSLDCPDKYIFDAAQKRVQALMESDAYLRFLQSDLYKELLHPESSLPKPEAL